MKTNLSIVILLCLFLAGCKSGAKETSSLTKTVLLEQLKSTHTKKEWFVPVNIALEGVTAEQAVWRDSSGNHSIGQLAYHLAFWNEHQLAKFYNKPKSDFSGSNDETFNTFDKDSWKKTVTKVDSILNEWEKAIEAADEEKLKEWYPTLANISTHNAYHTGQIIYIRKLQKAWDPEKGVK